MKKIFVAFLSVAILLSLCACSNNNSQNLDSGNSNQNNSNNTGVSAGDTDKQDDSACNHSWNEATCTAPKTCSACGATEGKAAGHSWNEATCTAPKTCSACGATEGKKSYHTWDKATCIAPKTCSVCGATEGKVANHTWGRGTCTTPMTCIRCGAVEGKVPGHSWDMATCTAPKTCSACGITDGEATGHSWNKAACTTPTTCSKCGLTEGVANGHSWETTTSTTSKTCADCKVTVHIVPSAGDSVMNANYDKRAAANAAQLPLINGLGMSWDNQYAYLVYSGTGETPKVSADGVEIILEEVSKNTNTVMKVKLETIGVDPEMEGMTVFATIGGWSGYVVFERTDVVYGNEVAHSTPLSDSYYDESVAQSQAEISGNTYSFSVAEQGMGFGGDNGPISGLKAGDGTSVVEFDFEASKIFGAAYWNGVQGTNGPILFYIRDDIENIFGFAIIRDHADNQYKLVAAPQGAHIYVTLPEFALNKTMHFRIEIDHAPDETTCMRYYVDGKLILVHEDAAYTPVEDVTGIYAQGMVILMGRYASTFTLSNVSFGIK